jgi:hypothetical protein
MDEPEAISRMLNSRYHEIHSGKVKPLQCDDIEAYFREKLAATVARWAPEASDNDSK